MARGLEVSIQSPAPPFLPANYLNLNVCQDRHPYTDFDYLSHSMGGFGFSAQLSTWPDSARKKLTEIISGFKHIRRLLLQDYHGPKHFPHTKEDPVTVHFGEWTERLTFEFDPPNARCVRANESA